RGVRAGLRRGGRRQGAGDHRTQDGSGDDHHAHHPVGDPPRGRGPASPRDGGLRMAEIARQHWSAERYAETAHFVPALGAPVLELLAPAPGEHILDLGCGDGVLTERIVAAGATVVAVYAGHDTVAAARARRLGARGLVRYSRR